MNEKQLVKDIKLCSRWAIGISIVLVVIWPGIMFSTGYVYSLEFFKGWVLLSFIWLIAAGLFIIFRPVYDWYQDKKSEKLSL